ncbi:MAG: right-handed parallel beta-helix repeat-containing protein [Nitrospiraceae bacterium]
MAAGVLLALLSLSACRTYRVDSVVDAPDANPGDHVCARAVAPGSEAGSPGGLCTLRAAVMESNASVWRDTIEVPAGLYRLTIPLNAGGGGLHITDGVKIQGAGAAGTIIDGNRLDSVIYVDHEGLELNHVTVQGGLQQFGGGLRLNAGTSELSNLILRDNEAFTGGGGLLVADGAVGKLRRSTVTENHAVGAFGGGIQNKGELWVYDTTISGNESNRAGGIRNEGQLNLRNVTISGNVASSPEAGTGGISQNGFAVLNNVTITDNTGVGNNAASFRGGGIQVVAGKTTVVKNSIIAGNHGGIGPNDCDGSLSGDSKYNLIGDTNGCTIPLYVSTFVLSADLNWEPSRQMAGRPPLICRQQRPAIEVAISSSPGSRCLRGRWTNGAYRGRRSNGHCDMGAAERTSLNVFITGFMLVDAATNTDLIPLLHGDRLVLSSLPAQLSIRAVVSGAAGSVRFGYDSTPAIQTENVAPYALAGDTAGDYMPFSFNKGTHTVTATPFASSGGAGAAGGSLSISIVVE